MLRSIVLRSIMLGYHFGRTAQPRAPRRRTLVLLPDLTPHLASPAVQQ